MLQLIDKPRDAVAWDRFSELSLLAQESDAYRYVHLRDLYSQSFALPIPSEPDVALEPGVLIFVNGAYCPAISQVPKPIIALPLSQAFKTYGAFLKPRLQRLLKDELDPFAALNIAYSTEGLFLYLPPNTLCETPLKILHFIDAKEPSLMCPRIHVFAGKGSCAKLSFSQKIPTEHLWANSFIDFALDEGASITLDALHDQHEGAHDFLALRGTLKSGSLLRYCGATNGGATSRHDYSIRLQGERAEAALNSVWGLSGKRQHHAYVRMEHQEPFCRSLQKFKGMLRDSARSSFEGKIYVHQKAQKTEAFQSNKNLLLSEQATVYSKPNLEIFADDVKASHGSTIGQLDAEQLFYLTARGLPEALAKKLLIRGFGQEITDLMGDLQMREEALEAVS